VLEQLGDPLVHMLRNSVDHGIETPEEREAKGKQATGTIKLTAEHQGGHVRVTIVDDGKGIDRNVIAEKAVEKGLATPDGVAQLSDSEVFKFIFAAGFSTAAQVSDLSGRGVGMDVVRTNIAKLGGQVNVQSTVGQGSVFEILIPLTVAIMPAMMVGISGGDFAIPIMSIYEIVKPLECDVESVAGHPAIRLRDEVLPLIDMRDQLSLPPAESGEHRFAVVVGVGEEKAGLLVDRLGGQQEIVIKPIDDEYTTGGPFSGATIKEDGDVGLIIDVMKVIRSGNTAPTMTTA
ncbi:MAG: chemotaxis protein CheW, partial [Planctomycetota bacterium]